MKEKLLESSPSEGVRIPETSGAADPIRDPEQVLDEEQKRWLRPLGPVAASLAYAGFGLNRFLMRLLFRVTTNGQENLPEQGPYVIAPNHVSHLDPMLLAAALSQDQLAQMYWAARSGATQKNVIRRTASRLAKTIPVDGGTSAHYSLAFGSAVLERGNILVWFPEGTRSFDGKLQRFKTGLGRLLMQHQVPVVPVYLSGAHEAMPRGSAFPRFGTPIRILFGKPVDSDELEDLGTGKKPYQRIAAGLRQHMQQFVDSSGISD